MGDPDIAERRPSILLVTRHYPPAVSGGARRPFLLAAALRELGADVSIVAPDLPESELGWKVPLLHAAPAGDGAGPPTPVSLPARARALAREWLLWPDPDIRWARRAVAAVRARPPTTPPDWVLSTSPPESIHHAGLALATAFSAHWAADFRDHWLVRPHRKQRLKLHRRIGEAMIARRWLARADLVTCVDPVVAAEIAAWTPRPPKVLAHFAPRPAPPAELGDDARIQVVHTGSFSLSDPDCRIGPLITAFTAARIRNPALRLRLAGRLTSEEREEAAQLGDAVVFHGLLPLEQAHALQAAADALVFVGSSKMHVPPSKVVEYAVAGAPIIACGPGPWRGGQAWPDPVEALAGLTRRKDHAPVDQTFDAVAAARQLLGWMTEHGE